MTRHRRWKTVSGLSSGEAISAEPDPGIDQDVAIWTSQQQGLRSRGYRGEYLPAQERRIKFFHDNIDRYLAMGPLP